MLTRALPITLALALAAAVLPAAAQTSALAGCAGDAGCAPFPQPVGLYISGVEESGRYIALEDGSLWEVEISDRATTASWLADDFVNLSWISAPRGDFRYLLARVGDREQQAAVRLAGRRPGPVDGEPMDQE
jgi:hypothetical protein